MIGITTAGLTGNIENFSEMRGAGIQQIDCSITAILGVSSISDVNLRDVVTVNEKLESNGIRCNLLQSIFYGSDNIFEDSGLLKLHIEKCFSIIEELKCDSLLFGSPQQRKDLKFTKTLIKNMNELANHHDKIIAIENLDLFDEVWGQKAIDIQEEIFRSSLSNCFINLHVFVEDTLDLSALESKKIRSIHLSSKNYESDLVKRANVETIVKVKNLYKEVPSLCLEMTNCSLQQSVNEFNCFKKMWENL